MSKIYNKSSNKRNKLIINNKNKIWTKKFNYKNKFNKMIILKIVKLMMKFKKTKNKMNSKMNKIIKNKNKIVINKIKMNKNNSK